MQSSFSTLVKYRNRLIGYKHSSGIVLKSKAKGNTVSVNVELVVKEEEGPLNRKAGNRARQGN